MHRKTPCQMGSSLSRVYIFLFLPPSNLISLPNMEIDLTLTPGANSYFFCGGGGGMLLWIESRALLQALYHLSRAPAFLFVFCF
jgi:hypothetical protein